MSGNPDSTECAKGAPDFEGLVSQYRRPLTTAAYHLCGDREMAQDVVQETLVAAYRAFASLRDSQRAGAWLFAILRRKAADYRRSRRVESELPEELPAPASGELERVMRGILLDQLNRLPGEDREILAGKYLLGLSYQELAESLGIKEGTVRVRCFRAKERLREALRGTGIGSGDEHGM